jgi:hypothetical protein
MTALSVILATQAWRARAVGVVSLAFGSFALGLGISATATLVGQPMPARPPEPPRPPED